MEAVEKKRKQKVAGNRILLKEEAANRVASWAGQVQAQLRGTRVGRNEIVNWLVLGHEPKLSSRELKDVEDTYYDEVKFASWALRQLKQARDQGRPISLTELLAIPDSSDVSKSLAD